MPPRASSAFNQGQSSRTEDATCPICQERYSSSRHGEAPIKLNCGHEIGLRCASLWLLNRGRDRKCPICRADVNVGLEREVSVASLAVSRSQRERRRTPSPSSRDDSSGSSSDSEDGHSNDSLSRAGYLDRAESSLGHWEDDLEDREDVLDDREALVDDAKRYFARKATEADRRTQDLDRREDEILDREAQVRRWESKMRRDVAEYERFTEVLHDMDRRASTRRRYR